MKFISLWLSNERLNSLLKYKLLISLNNDNDNDNDNNNDNDNDNDNDLLFIYISIFLNINKLHFWNIINILNWILKSKSKLG
jgi:hypothetical protein